MLSISLSTAPMYGQQAEYHEEFPYLQEMYTELEKYCHEVSQNIGSFIQEKKLFFQKFLNDYQTIGAIAPSSRYLSKAMTKHLKAYKDVPLQILEVGAGTGVFTEYIIKYMSKESTLHVVELDEGFCTMLKGKFKDYPNVHIYCCDITKFKLKEKVDFIVSGLPFHSFPHNLVQEILDTYIQDFIKPNGIITFFEYAFFPTLKKILLRDKNYKKVLDTLQTFKKNRVASTEDIIMRNVPPARVIKCSC